jgi:hypothetical protein
MTHEQISAANRASALEQVEQDKRNEELKAQIKAERFVNARLHRPRWSGDDYPGQEVNELISSNARAVEVETHRYDEQNN